MRLLIATGGSHHSEAALYLGAHILEAQRIADPPTLITVIRRAADRPRAERILATACDNMGLKISEVQLKVRAGYPAQEIISEAATGDYDLVIVGERPKHRLMTRFLGSTAVRVIEHAPCPVIIAKGKTDPIRRVLLCDSGAMRPSVLNRFTVQFFDLLESKVEITVLHVMSQITAGPGVSSRQLLASAEELIQEHAPEGEFLARDIQALGKLKVHSSPKVRHGLVVDEILAEARSGDYDLVVIGDYQGQGWGRFLLDNLAHQIVVRIDRPVLVVR